MVGLSKKIIAWLGVLGLVISASGCLKRQGGPAPIEEIKWRPFSQSQQSYVVRRGDTLYAVAFRYDRDYQDLARANGLNYPYHLRVGQVLRLSGTRRSTYVGRILQRPILTKKPQYRTSTPSFTSFFPGLGGQWAWPANGRVVTGFFPAQGKKGINIAGKKGEIVRASSNGVVAYAGNGLSGYGNLIIIKHNREFLTAYGNNSKNLVREGQAVKRGQAIAYMGLIDRKYWGTHFEIRRGGQPVNPLNYLKKR